MSSTIPERSAVVALPTHTVPRYIQTIVGKRSPISTDVEEFRGIPYADIPGRWEHSQLRDKLPRDIFDATQNGPKCPQPSGPNDSRTYQSYARFPDDSEDEFNCLNLFIVRPTKEALAKQDINLDINKLPTLLWIHGGGYGFGAGTDPIWDPTNLVLRALETRNPIIAVVINYRLNVFGFGASSDIIATQTNSPLKGVNFGVRDQKLALTWVRRNISAFGGDPAKVTIGGQSAGASSCHTHLLEAELSNSKPLFRKAILQSGSMGCLGPTSLKRADENWKTLYQHCSIDAESAAERIDLLKRIPTQDLLASVGELNWVIYPLVIDDLTIKESNLGCDVTINLGEADLHNEIKDTDANIQVLLGLTENEASIWVTPGWDYSRIYQAFTAGYPSKDAAEEALLAYNILPTSSNDQLYDSLVNFLTDSMLGLPVHKAREFFKSHRRKQAYLRGQDLTRVGIQSFHIEFGNPFPGPEQGVSHHCVELIYLFDAFREALEKADRGILEGYVEPEERPSDWSDSGLGSPAEELKAPGAELGKYGLTNVELAHEIQDKWITFIVEDVDASEKRANADEITTYGADRVARVESLVNDNKWAEKNKRYDILQKDWPSVVNVRRTIQGSVLN